MKYCNNVIISVLVFEIAYFFGKGRTVGLIDIGSVFDVLPIFYTQGTRIKEGNINIVFVD